MRKLNTLRKFFVGLAIAFLVFLFIKNRRDPIKYAPAWIGSKYVGLRSYISAQAKHETSNYKHLPAIQRNNYFGMKNANVRSQNGFKVDGDQYRNYHSANQSLADLFLWLDYNNAPTKFQTAEEYVSFLKQKDYFEDSVSNYLNGLKSWL